MRPFLALTVLLVISGACQTRPGARDRTPDTTPLVSSPAHVPSPREQDMPTLVGEANAKFNGIIISLGLMREITTDDGQPVMTDAMFMEAAPIVLRCDNELAQMGNAMRADDARTVWIHHARFTSAINELIAIQDRAEARRSSP